MGRIPRKCKLRGPCGVTSGVTSRLTSGYSVHFAGKSGKIPAKFGFVNKIWPKSSENLSNLAKFGEKIANFSEILKKTEKFSALRAAFFRKNPCISMVQRRALRRSRRELSNAYLLAKFGFDTAENEHLTRTI